MQKRIPLIKKARVTMWLQNLNTLFCYSPCVPSKTISSIPRCIFVFHITKMLVIFQGQKTIGQGSEEEKQISPAHVLPKTPRAKQQKPLLILGEGQGFMHMYTSHSDGYFSLCLRVGDSICYNFHLVGFTYLRPRN